MKCQFYNKKTGKHCQAWALKGEKFCYLHSKDPKIVKARKEAQKKGGEQLKLRTEKVPVARLKSVRDITRFHNKLIKMNLKGTLDDKRFNLLSNALGRHKEMIETSEIETRLDKMEENLD